MANVREPLIEALVFRFHQPEAYTFDEIEEALSFIERGEDDCQLSGVGLMLAGHPILWTASDPPREPSEKDAASMLGYYATAKGRSRASEVRQQESKP